MKWFEIKAKADVSEIWLYEEIGKNWFGEGTGAKEFIAELNAIKSPQIDLHINSPGGAVFDGSAIANAIMRHPANVTSYIDGIAASIATVIALAGDKVVMAENALFMIHNPSGVCMGTSEDMRKTADVLDKVCDTMCQAYMSASGMTEEEIKKMMSEETWMNADEAISAGFCDEVGAEMDMAACAKFIPAMAEMGYKHVPRNILAKKEPLSEREAERALRDAGCSASKAKSILAHGYSGALRDEGPPAVPANGAPPPRDEGKAATANASTKIDRFTELYMRAEMTAPSTK